MLGVLQTQKLTQVTRDLDHANEMIVELRTGIVADLEQRNAQLIEEVTRKPYAVVRCRARVALRDRGVVSPASACLFCAHFPLMKCSDNSYHCIYMQQEEYKYDLCLIKQSVPIASSALTVIGWFR